MDVWPSMTSGFGVGLGLIVAIGAQNLLVLQHGIAKTYPAITALICIVCDVTLILFGVMGLGATLMAWPTLIVWFRYLGALWLLILAMQNFRSAFSDQALSVTDANEGPSLWAVIGATLAVTLLNPHVYLDTVILLGGLSTQYAYPMYFALGAVIASILWFSALAFAGVQLAPLLSRPQVWRRVNVLIGLALLLIAGQLAFGFNRVLEV